MVKRGEMPRVTLLGPDGEPEYEEPESTIEKDIEDQLDDILAEFGQSETDVTWQVLVTRASGPNMKGVREPYCFACDPSELHGIRERIRDEYGEGNYRIRVRRNGRNFRQFDYAIDAVIKPKEDGTKGIERELLKRMDGIEQRNQELIERFVNAARVQQIQPPAMDPIAMLTAISAVVANLSGAVAKPVAPAVDPMQIMSTTFDMAAKLADMRSDSTNGESNWIDVIREFAKQPEAVKALLSPQIPPQVQQPNPPQRRPMNAPIQTPPAVTPSVAETTGNAQYDLPNAIRYLNSRAKNDSPVELYCDWVFDNLDQNIITSIMDTPNILDQLQAQFPMMQQHRPWYDRLLAEMKLAVDDAMRDNATPQGASDDGNSASLIDRFAGRTGNSDNT